MTTIDGLLLAIEKLKLIQIAKKQFLREAGYELCDNMSAEDTDIEMVKFRNAKAAFVLMFAYPPIRGLTTKEIEFAVADRMNALTKWTNAYPDVPIPPKDFSTLLIHSCIPGNLFK